MNSFLGGACWHMYSCYSNFLPLNMVFSCTGCFFRSSGRLELIKHTFQAHSVEPSFHFVCGIKGCLHAFKFGATYSSFKSHANRKHANWQEHVDADSGSTSESPVLSPPQQLPVLTDSPPLSDDDDLEAETDHDVNTMELSPDRIQITEQETPVFSVELPERSDSRLVVQKAAALFLLSFKEKYLLPQVAINFAVGSIQQIVESACLSALSSAQEIDPSSVSSIMENLEDPFALLNTNYQQNKFYKEKFGLVVS